MGLFDENYWVPGKGRELSIKYEKIILFFGIVYLPVIWFLQKYMKNKKKIEALFIKKIWNFSLSLLSLIGALTIIIYNKNILKYIILEESEYTPQTRAVITIFTLSKAVEYGDTIFLILKKKPLTFLHIYHHLTVTLYCFYSQKELVSHAHYFVFLNLCIHTIMYCYYGLVMIIPKIVLKIRKLITALQIIQMVIGMTISYHAIRTVDNRIHLNNAIISFLLYLSYAFLFLNFYFTNYYKNIKSMVAINMISIHILGAVGFIMICKSKDILRLSVEIFIGSIFTLTLLQLSFYFNKHYYQILKNIVLEKHVIEQTQIFKKYKQTYDSNMATLKKITLQIIKTCLLCFNGIMTYAHDTIFIFVNLYSNKVKTITNDSILIDNNKTNKNVLNSDPKIKNKKVIDSKNMLQKQEETEQNKKKEKEQKEYITLYKSIKKLISSLYNSSIIHLIVLELPKENISINTEKNLKNPSKHLKIWKSIFYFIKELTLNYLVYTICLILPVYYGFKAYNDAILGLCVHGGLRWLIEIHLTKMFKKDSKVKFH
ncbi:long chain fatty acid elongation enzyme, putative [Hepatocystis sp. ex Piliocolobus tephrosceles]|nr:long chain fatty acid elongation enzyme, putative [Hepatocystis sp. ex Piliocolobus tephrosceles]